MIIRLSAKHLFVGRCESMRWCVLLCLALATLVPAFENADSRRRKKALRQAANAIKHKLTVEFSTEEIQCAACEATARQIEDKLRKGGGKQKTTVDRLEMLYAACETVDEQLPNPLDPLDGNGGKVLQFFANQAAQEQMLKEHGRKFYESGLSEFCTTLIEEHEEVLSLVMAKATTVGAAGASVADAFADMFELKVPICVQTTKQCTDDALNRISQARMGLATKDPALRQKLAEMMAAKQKAEL
jgi:hypothetical protein